MKQANPAQQNPDRPFYDVFISYRHRDADAVAALSGEIEAAGFEVFCDKHFTGLNDPDQITRQTIETIREHIAKATCLIVAYSRRTAQQGLDKGEPVGVWMPWELGYFDGALSSRIAVYLLDGPRGDVDPKTYYKGCEYLQLYEELTEQDLPAYLARMAVRERRIDNVGSAFTWMSHLARECLANPLNVSLGVAEWYADHGARWCEAVGLQDMAAAYRHGKQTLDDLRVGMVRNLRIPLFDELRPGSIPTMLHSKAPRPFAWPGLPGPTDAALATPQGLWRPAMIQMVQHEVAKAEEAAEAAPEAGQRRRKTTQV